MTTPSNGELLDAQLIVEALDLQEKESNHKQPEQSKGTQMVASSNPSRYAASRGAPVAQMDRAAVS